MRFELSKNGTRFGFTLLYDNGLVAVSVPDLNSALALTPAQQAAIGFFCGGQRATVSAGISECTSPNFGATRLIIPAPGTADPDHNPPRIAARYLFDLAVGTENLLKTDRTRMTLRFTVVNLAN